MSYIKDVDLPRHAWDTPPFLLIVSPTPPVQSVDAYVRALGQSRDNQTKRGWPYSMSMRLFPASTAMKTTFPSKKKKTNKQASKQTLCSFQLLFAHFWNAGRTTNLPQSSFVSLFHLWSKQTPRHFAVNFTMWLHVSHFNHWAPPTEMIERVANEKLLYIFLQKKWRHITRFVPAFRRRFL